MPGFTCGHFEFSDGQHRVYIAQRRGLKLKAVVEDMPEPCRICKPRDSKMGADYDDVILVDVDDFVPQLFENQPRPRDGRVLNSSGSAVSQARVTLTDGNSVSRIVLTNGFGYYHFDEVPAGQTYIFNVQHKRYQFSPLALNVMEETNDLNFVALP